MLVLEGGRPLAGPRDARPACGGGRAAVRGDYLGIVGARERWRLALGEVPPGCGFRGWIFLAWGDDVAVEPVRACERLPRLARASGPARPSAEPDRGCSSSPLYLVGSSGVRTAGSASTRPAAGCSRPSAADTPARSTAIFTDCSSVYVRGSGALAQPLLAEAARRRPVSRRRLRRSSARRARGCARARTRRRRLPLSTRAQIGAGRTSPKNASIASCGCRTVRAWEARRARRRTRRSRKGVRARRPRRDRALRGSRCRRRDSGGSARQ